LIDRPSRRLQILLRRDATYGLADRIDESGGMAAPQINLSGEESLIVKFGCSLNDLMTHVFEQPRGRLDGCRYLSVQRQPRPNLCGECDAKAICGSLNFLEVRHRRTGNLKGVSDCRPFEYIKRSCAIGHASSQSEVYHHAAIR